MTVKVRNGNLQDALAVLKASVKREGIMKDYKKHEYFTPKRERKYKQK